MNEPSVICPEDREELLRVGYTELELEKLSAFAHPFCKTGRLYLARIFVRGKLYKKPFSLTLKVCSALFALVWKHGSPDRIGDPDDVAPPNVGIMNTCAFYNAYKLLGMPSPKFLF